MKTRTGNIISVGIVGQVKRYPNITIINATYWGWRMIL